MSRNKKLTAVLAAILLSACAPNVYELVPEEVTSRDMAPPGAPPGTCWGRDATPAVIQTVTEQVILEETSDSPVYQTETSQQIITPREDTWFETPCDNVVTPDFTASVQRALAARGHYRGPITGRMDGRTQAAIRAYQKPQGLDSGMLSLAAARQMGLLQVDLDTAGVELPEVSVADVSVPAAETVAQPPVSESAAAHAARLAEEQKAERLAAIERSEAAKRDAAEQAARRAAEEKRIAEAARLAEDAAAEDAKRAAERAAAEEALREKNKRAKELAQALEDEKKRTGGTVFEPLPISTEGY